LSVVIIDAYRQHQIIRFQQLRQERPALQAAYAAIFALGLSSCGGGGGGGTPDALASAANSSTPTTLPTTASTGGGYLVLSEIATNYYGQDTAWVEVYNPGATSVSLSRYALRTSSYDPATRRISTAPARFALPAVEVPPRGHLVIAARTAEQLRDNSQMVYVREGATVPYWTATGAGELVQDNGPPNFVRFGNATGAPLTADAGRSGNVAALPFGAAEHGKSIVRLAAGGMADTDAASDWAQVNFATPAGANDVPPGVLDSDGDGIPDSAKVGGGTYGGLDLYAMGARRGRRDIFVEIDYMPSADAATTPRLEALQKIENAFAVKGIALHLDTGDLYGAGFDPARYNLGGGNPVAFSRCIDLDSVGAGTRANCASFMAYKSGHFDVRRKLLFHYALFANTLTETGASGSSGIAELYGNDLIVTLGNYGLNAGPGASRNLLINLQASTLMHELGHNLGLHHGGDENANYKPNHYSVMNYMYQFAGLSATPNSVHAAERYYLAHNLKGKTLCGLVENSPCGDQFILSYSDGSSADLDENNLSEAANIGRGAAPGAYADWDGSNGPTPGLMARDINNPMNEVATVTRGLLHDYNEWGNLVLPFARDFSGSNSGNTLAQPAPRVRTHARMTERERVRERRQIVEEPLPLHLHNVIRQLDRHRHRR